MRNVLILILSLGLAASASAASAECLPATARADLEATLLARFRASRLSVDQLEHHALTRLGLGGPISPASTATDDERRIALAARIAASLTRAAVVPATIESDLAAISVDRTLPGLPKQIYRHAATTMTEAYSEVERVRRQILVATSTTEKARLSNLRVRVVGDVRAAAQARAMALLYLSAPLDIGAVVGEFWNNHFNTSATKVAFAVVDYQRALRANVCGSFREILGTSAHHPAMSIYLDNAKSKIGAINENYGRELMELHTLGDDKLQYYDHEDIRSVARALTGWGVSFDSVAANTWTPAFRFYQSSHDPAALDLFGHAPRGLPLHLAAAPVDRRGVPTPEAVSRGEQVLDYLAQHPATRRNICIKLAVRLIGVAPAGLVSDCASASVWGTTGDLGAIYRYLLTTPEMWGANAPDAAQSYQAKVKNPIELLVSAHRTARLARASILDVAFMNNSARAISQLGIDVAMVAPPTGYADDGRWRSPGSILRWTPDLFANLDPSGLAWVTPTGTLRGAALERAIGDRISQAISAPDLDAALTTLATELTVGMLGLPADHRASAAALKGALLLPDKTRATSAPARARSFAATTLASRQFLRK